MQLRGILIGWLLVAATAPVAQARTLPQESAATQAAAPAEITAERVQAAWEDVLALCGDVGLERDQAPALEMVSRSALRRVLRTELLPQMLAISGGDEASARSLAQQSASAFSRIMLAKFSWTDNRVLVCADSWRTLARALARPELCGDEVLRAVLVHELVHAADARLHDFPAVLATRSSEEELRAIDAVLEGNAQRVARDLCARRGWSAGFEIYTDAVGAPPAASEDDPAANLMARVLGASLATSYRQGEVFMRAIAAAAGAEGIAAVFRDPPRDLGAVFRPEWHLDPASRPVLAHDLEAGLDVLAAPGQGDGWAARRMSLTPAVMLAGMGDLPREDIERVLRSLRATRLVVLQPEKQPDPRMRTLALMSFQEPADALAMRALEERVARRKDEIMTRGSVRVVSAEYGTLEGGDEAGVRVEGFWCAKRMSVQGSEQTLRLAVVARGALLAEVSFVEDPADLSELVDLAVRALLAAELPAESR